MDVTALSDTDLAALRDQVLAETERRAHLANIPATVDALATQYLIADGATPGAAWRQPTGAHDAYPAGWRVRFGGKDWESLIGGNVWQPGDAGDPQSYRWWKDLTPVEPPAGPAAWDGNAHPYIVGDVVTYGDATYTCRQAHTSQPGWTPAAVPALWAKQTS